MQPRISHTIRKLFVVFLLSVITILLSCTQRIAHDGADDTTPVQTSSSAVDINRATREELERLPSIGPGLAQKIVEHRKRFGPFRRVEQLILIEGISDKRFRRIRHLLTVR